MRRRRKLLFVEPRRGNKTIEDYFALPEGSPIELIDGEFVVSASPFMPHVFVSCRLFNLLTNQVRALKLGHVFHAPCDVLLPTGDAVQPDVIFIARKREAMIGDRIRGTPDLLVEVLSKGDERRDKVRKRRVYRDAGVPEYWIVDPASRTVRVLSAGESDWNERELGGSDVLESPRLPGVSIRLAELFETE